MLKKVILFNKRISRIKLVTILDTNFKPFLSTYSFSIINSLFKWTAIKRTDPLSFSDFILKEATKQPTAVCHIK